MAKDQGEANRLYRAAAEQSDSGAQTHLCLAFKSGSWGFPADFVESYMWLNLAAAQGDSIAETNRKLIAAKMTPEQIAEAQRRSTAFVPRKSRTAAGEK